MSPVSPVLLKKTNSDWEQPFHNILKSTAVPHKLCSTFGKFKGTAGAFAATKKLNSYCYQIDVPEPENVVK